ncbi:MULTISPECIES: GTP cyclohydrolase III [unclassified Halorubrum]|nr:MULTISPECIES: GTP cyclohydrolase III [unclassified Halorubrum]OYR44392.1 GTP cyclohydrolase IIa [Halorubrum sp. Hd13]OYR52519.1 GTP cyclohydrolase IIa [Halorubrum sp. Ea8]OYR53339.1 GTP cyclohydrolase IIa [Halorubrum sp. Ea1]
MTTTQVTLVQIDNYGPWTTTPEPRREMDLQTLQSRLFADIAQFVGHRDAYVFFTRFDNMIAVTNGVDDAAHAALQESIGNRYPVSISLGTAVDERPVDALEAANQQLQHEGSAQDKARTEVLAGEYLTETTVSDLQVAHFDVVNATGKYTDRLNEFDTFINIERAYASLMRYLREQHGALSFFVGGDNIISVCPDLPERAFAEAVAHVKDDVEVELQVGVGRGATAHEAGFAAKHALEDCRHDGTSVELFGAPAAGD